MVTRAPYADALRQARADLVRVVSDSEKVSQRLDELMAERVRLEALIASLSAVCDPATAPGSAVPEGGRVGVSDAVRMLLRTELAKGERAAGITQRLQSLGVLHDARNANQIVFGTLQRLVQQDEVETYTGPGDATYYRWKDREAIRNDAITGLRQAIRIRRRKKTADE